MPKTLSKIRDENKSEFDATFPTNQKVWVTYPKGGPSARYLKYIDAISSHLSTSESHIIEGIKEWAKERIDEERSAKSANELEEVDERAYCAALSDLIAFLDEGLTGNK